jgi:hypothetical protein
MASQKSLVRFWGRKPDFIIRKYIDSSDSVVVDSFGGSGSIALATLERGKRAIYADINPYAWLVAHVQIAGADPEEFLSSALHVLSEASESWRLSSSAKLPNDYLYYHGAPFLKKRNFDRVSDFFPPENRMKLRAILTSIDKAETSIKTKLALYLAFCAALYPSSYMNRCNAGSWGIPSYWVPVNNCPRDSLRVFESVIKRLYAFFKNTRFYNVCYNESCEAEARVLLKDALAVKYRKEWTLVTDPPHTDEIQYGELSYFYWVWLRTSEFPILVKSLTGRRPRLDLSREIIVNKARGKSLEKYLWDIYTFMLKVKKLRKKVLIMHEENNYIVDKIVNLAKEAWGNTIVELMEIEKQRNIGAKGNGIYTVIISDE